MSDELSKAYEPTEVEAKWYPRWLEAGYFTADANSTKPGYCIVLPPPNVTGSLHLGHALTATIQDILIRFKRMSGFNCLWLPGTDHAGIATQMMVEKDLFASEKKTRHDLGREAFLQRVWAWKAKYGARIGVQHQKLGASLDWSRERFTMDEGVSAAVREVFVQLHDQGLLYRASKLINWDPSLRTALSDLEVENQESQGSLWHIAYPVEGSEERLVVATTRPETMLGDTAVAVHPEDPRFKHLVGKRVQVPLVNRSIPIIGDAVLVSMEFGTGAVKVTPAHDHNDYQTGLRHQLPQISIFDESGICNENAGPFVGVERFEARKQVVAALEAQGLLVKVEPHTVSLPISQRSGAVVEPRLCPQWFVKTKPLADAAIAAVEAGKTRFVPEGWTNTFYSWMRNIHDWCVSRQLWWGHQIPAWYPANGPKRADGSLDFERANPVVARQSPGVTQDNPSGEWVQDPDVLDTWFSSGLWPFSTLGWPEKTAELKAFYPNAVMETGHDIIFFWVARMMMMGLHFMGEVPFRTVYLHAMVRDEKGQKMSKTKGNVIDPIDLIEGAPLERLPGGIRNKVPKDASGKNMPAMGADAVRFTLASLTQQGRDIKLSVERIAGYKAFCNKLWNASRFAMMNLGDFQAEPGLPITSRSLSLVDRWVLSRLEVAVAGVTQAIENYQFAEAASTLYQFIWGEFCDWYIELSKGSLYGTDETAKTASRATLVHVLDTTLRLLHPFMPFITEEIWQRLPIVRDAPSLCVARFPSVNTGLRDEKVEAALRPVIDCIDAIRAIRGESNLSPALKLDAHVQVVAPAVRATLEANRTSILQLAGLGQLFVTDVGAKPAQAAADLRGGLEVYVPLAGLVDLAEERQRLEKEIAKAEAEAANMSKRLENPDFVARAPAEVVEKDTARVAELKARAAKLAENLKRIAPVEVKIAPVVPGGTVNLGEELKADLAQVEVPATDAHVAEALEKLRAGTQDGLSAQDRRDLSVAYYEMGLVDDAVREYAKATEEQAKPPRPTAPLARKPAKSSSKKKAAPKKKAARQAKPAAKKPAAKTKKPAVKKKAVKKAATPKKVRR
jgi:valyl-tRNA synthetase